MDGMRVFYCFDLQDKPRCESTVVSLESPIVQFHA